MNASRFAQTTWLLLTVCSAHSASLTLSSPTEYQIVQRDARNHGTLFISGRFSGGKSKDVTFQARLVIDGNPAEWHTISVAFTNENFSATLASPAGGWYRLETRFTQAGDVLAQAFVTAVGIGEIFVVAGQSNSANHGEEKQHPLTGRVSAFDGTRWRLAEDPQPGASGNAGSFLPPFGDALVRRFDVPIGLVACGIGATSVREWLPKGTSFHQPPTLTGRVQQRSDGLWESNGEAFDMLVTRIKSLGSQRFRAVLWHQGESDANQADPTRTLPGNLYRQYLEKIIRDSRRALGWEIPWFVALVSYHVPGDEGSPDIRAAQASLWEDHLALPGPDSDALKGELRENGGKGVHFSGAGLRAHATAWANLVMPWLENSLGPLVANQDLPGATPLNELPNPSFEQGTSKTVPGWKPRAWHGESECRWTVEQPGRTGQRCISIRSERGSDAAWTATVKVKANTFYRLSGWIRTRDVKGAVGALLNIQNLQQVRTPAMRGTRDWTRVETVFRTADLSELEINCLFGGWGDSTGQAWFDDLALELLPDFGQDPTRALITIAPYGSSVAYSPRLFGGFIEHFDGQIYGGIFEPGSPLSDNRGFRKDVIAALKELKLSIVRWPGGCFASGYHWKDGVGQTRTPVPDPVWGVTDPNTFGTAEFVEWCRRVNCEPYICSNAGNGTPEEMRDWVEYCNATRGPFADLRHTDGFSDPLGVRFWSIGNENWGGHEIGAKTPQEWGPLVRRSAELMRQVGPKLTLLAAATPSPDWTLPLLKASGELLNYVAIHEYWLPCWQENHTPDYLSCIMHSSGPESTIARVIDLLDQAGCRGRVKIAFDEWNLRGWHHPGFPRKEAHLSGDPKVAELVRAREKNALPSQYTMADALFSASFLNACLRHAEDVGMANIAPIVNTRGPLYVHPQGLVKRTTFHTLSLYANELESNVVKTDVEAGFLLHGSEFLPVVDAVATVDASGTRCTLALVNRHPTQQLSCQIRMKNALTDETFTATVLDGDSPEAFNDIEHPERVVPKKLPLPQQHGEVTLAPHSLTMLKFQIKPGS